MKVGREMIESCKMVRIECNLLRLRNVLDLVYKAHYPLSDNLAALHNIQPVVLSLVRDTNEVCGVVDFKLLNESDRLNLSCLLSDVAFAVESYEWALKDTKMMIDLPNLSKMPPKIAGRPKASTDKRLIDFLRGCDPEKVIRTIKNAPQRSRAGYFGQMLIALLDLGYISKTDIGKELYKAVKNDFPDAPCVDSIRKICPQNKHLIEDYKDKNRSKIEELKRLF